MATICISYGFHPVQLLITFSFYETNTAVSGNQQDVNWPFTASLNPYVGKIS